MQQAINLTLNRIQHIGIPVTDIKTSENFYERLGFRNVMEELFLYKGENGTAIMMQRNDMIIELYQMPENELAEIRQRKNGHIDHVAFDVQDIEKAFLVLKEADFNIIEEAPVFLQFWKKGCRYFNVQGPDGERLEFNQIL